MDVVSTLLGSSTAGSGPSFSEGLVRVGKMLGVWGWRGGSVGVWLLVENCTVDASIF